MNIHQHIYTKVSAEKSPHKKNGFQSLYYPIEFLPKKNVLDIESKIHFNGTEGIRKSVFFEKIAEDYHLIISYMVPLPDMKDEFGRSGMFLVHSFLFPSAVWNSWAHPLQADAYLSKIHVKNFQEIESYEGVNKQTGDLAPLEIPESAWNQNVNAAVLDMNEKLMFNVLYRIALKESDTLALAIQGKPQEIEQVLDRLVSRLPKPLWHRIGWHSAFDEGKIFFFPLKIVGFEKSKPITGEPVTFVLENDAFESGQQALLKPTSTFQNWVLTSAFDKENMDSINRIYELSEFLEDRRDIPQQPHLLESFLQANDKEFNRLLSNKLQSIVGNEWADILSKFASPVESVQLMLESMNKSSIVHLLEKISLQQNIDLRKHNIPNVLMAYLTPELQFLQKVFQDKAEYPLLFDTKPFKIGQIIKYLIHLKLNKYAWQTWFHYPKAEITEQEIIDSFKEYIAELSKTPKAIQPYLAETIYKDKRFSECLQGNWNWAEILDQTLSQKGWDLNIFPVLKSWAEKNNIRNEHLPWLECLIYAGKPSRIIIEQASESVIICWIKYHKMKTKEIIDKGFSQDLTESLYKKHAPGLFNKIKRFIGF